MRLGTRNLAITHALDGDETVVFLESLEGLQGKPDEEIVKDKLMNTSAVIVSGKPLVGTSRSGMTVLVNPRHIVTVTARIEYDTSKTIVQLLTDPDGNLHLSFDGALNKWQLPPDYLAPRPDDNYPRIFGEDAHCWLEADWAPNDEEWTRSPRTNADTVIAFYRPRQGVTVVDHTWAQQHPNHPYMPADQ